MKAISSAIVAVAGAIIVHAGYIARGDTAFALIVGYLAVAFGIGNWARSIISDQNENKPPSAH